MTNIARMRENNFNPFETVLANSKTAFLFLALILRNYAPRTMIVNRRTLARIPNERDDGKSMVGRPVKKVLSISPGPNCPAILLFQPTSLSDKLSEQRLDCKYYVFRFLHTANHRFGGVHKISKRVLHSLLTLMDYRRRLLRRQPHTVRHPTSAVRLSRPF